MKVFEYVDEFLARLLASLPSYFIVTVLSFVQPLKQFHKVLVVAGLVGPVTRFVQSSKQ